MKIKKIFIAIVAYGNSEQTVNLIKSLGQIGKGTGFTLCVIDNNKKQDKLVEQAATRLELYGHKVHYKHYKENIGFAAGMNRAANLIDGEELMCLINPDTEIPENFFEVASIYSIDEKIFGPITLDGNGKISESYKMNWGVSGIIKYRLLSYSRAQMNFVASVPNESFKVGWILGSCLFISTKTFKLLGGFDEKFFLCADDTADLLLRAKEAGIDSYICPKMRVTHFGGGSTKSVRKTSLGFAYFGHAYFLLKHKKYLSYLALLLTLGPAAVLKMIYHKINGSNEESISYLYAIYGLLMFDKKILREHHKK